MYVPYRQETEVNFKLPWDKFTARGFMISLSIIAVLIFLISVTNSRIQIPKSVIRI